MQNDQVVRANIEVHTRLADSYEATEPHFRPENIANVEARLVDVLKRVGMGALPGSATQSLAEGPSRLLDLGCGTGFMLRIAKPYMQEIHGVDVTTAMLEKVDTSGPATITLFEADSGKFQPEPGTYDVVTAYSFLHHLYDVAPTFRTAATALRPGGIFYADLEPNYYFWQAIHELDPQASYDPIVAREIAQVVSKEAEMQREWGIDPQVFFEAEYGKSTSHGFRAAELESQLLTAGFSRVEVFFQWFLGQASLINDDQYERETRFGHARAMDRILQRVLPLSCPLYKYLGFYATK
jgi:SAM-dependent methyltransferase